MPGASIPDRVEHFALPWLVVDDPKIRPYRSFLNLSEGKVVCIMEAPDQATLAAWWGGSFRRSRRTDAGTTISRIAKIPPQGFNARIALHSPGSQVSVCVADLLLPGLRPVPALPFGQ